MLDGVQARDALEQLTLAAACNACDAEDLAAHGGERDVVEALDAEIVDAGQALDLQPRLRVDGVRAVDVQADGAADHHVGQGLRRGLARLDGADVLALAQHGDLVRNGQHLVQLVGDEDDGLAVGAHVAHDLEQAVCLLRGQNGGRLVEDQDLRSAEQNLDDLDGLLLRNGKIVDLCHRIEVETVFFADVVNLLRCGANVELALFVQTENDILRDRQDIDQLEMLMDHADAVGKGILGGADLDFHAVFQNVPLLRHIDTGQHVHQRGLAAPVFSEEAQDLAALDGQVHAVVGNDLAKALCDVDQFNFAVRLQSGHPFLHGFAGEFA